jgi:hypothetical protein
MRRLKNEKSVKNLVAHTGEHTSVVDLPALLGIEAGPVKKEGTFLAWLQFITEGAVVVNGQYATRALFED